MADFPYVEGLGRAVELFLRVEGNDPANSAIIVMIINTTEVDATLEDLNTFAEILGNANTAEVTNTGYARKVLTDADIVVAAADEANDRRDLDFADQTWASVAAGTGWTDAVIGYDNDTAGGTDANIVPISQHDFVQTPNGGDITLQTPNGVYRSSQV